MTADIFVALIIGVLAGLGVGSGGLLILYLTVADGMDQFTAQGTNLAFFVFALGAALLVHLRKRELPLPVLGFLITFGTLGAALGSLTAGAVDTAWLRTALGWLLLGMGAVSLLRK